MELSKEKINEIVAMLKYADGEDVQEILVKSGWNDQMLTQLMMCEPIDDVLQMYEARLDHEEKMVDIRKYWIFESC
jgi:endonuclease YncB( thermonuclease family)